MDFDNDMEFDDDITFDDFKTLEGNMALERALEGESGKTRDLVKAYKAANQDLGKVSAILAINIPHLLSHKAPLALIRVLRGARNIYAVQRKRRAIEKRARLEDINIRKGPRKRNIFKGMLKKSWHILF